MNIQDWRLCKKCKNEVTEYGYGLGWYCRECKKFYTFKQTIPMYTVNFKFKVR